MHDKKLKILIFTFIYTNYGGILQAYALQRFLRSFTDFEVFNVNFRTNAHEKESSLFNFYGSFKSKISQLFFILLRFRGLRNRIKRTNSFKKEYFNFTSLYKSESQFLDSPPFADIYISGSDQVFNPEGFYKNLFYLNFDKGASKKISYAASFGLNNFTESQELFIKKHLEDFDYLSFREKEGAELVSSLLKKSTNWVLDPTFLLSAEEWMAISKKPNLSYKYIFVYALAEESKLIEIAREIQKVTNYRIVCTRSNTRDFLKADKFIYGSGPSEFLGLILNADYVVTDSFHGLAFSVIFKRPFYIYISRPEYSKRIKNLLNLIDANTYLYDHSSVQSFSFELNRIQLNYDKLNEMKKISKEFIIKSISQV